MGQCLHTLCWGLGLQGGCSAPEWHLGGFSLGMEHGVGSVGQHMVSPALQPRGALVGAPSTLLPPQRGDTTAGVAAGPTQPWHPLGTAWCSPVWPSKPSGAPYDPMQSYMAQYTQCSPVWPGTLDAALHSSVQPGMAWSSPVHPAQPFMAQYTWCSPVWPGTAVHTLGHPVQPYMAQYTQCSPV